MIPFQESVKIFSGTGSLQGLLNRQVIAEVSRRNSDESDLPASRYVWICYALDETSFTLHGPASALQVLQVAFDLKLRSNNSALVHPPFFRPLAGTSGIR